jgi:hypothetical protein
MHLIERLRVLSDKNRISSAFQFGRGCSLKDSCILPAIGYGLRRRLRRTKGTNLLHFCLPVTKMHLVATLSMGGILCKRGHQPSEKQLSWRSEKGCAPTSTPGCMISQFTGYLDSFNSVTVFLEEAC